MSNDAYDRRRVLEALGAGATIAVAGCVGGSDDDDDDATADDGTGDSGQDLLSTDPAPTGTELSSDDIDDLVDLFDDEPFRGGQETPFHVWKWVTDDSFIFLHFDTEDPRDAGYLNWLGVGTKGVWAEESRPGPEFTHFHEYDSETWGEGHHGDEPGEAGYWLTHIAVRDFEAQGREITTGVDYEFPPSDPPSYDGDLDPDFTVGDEGSIAAADVATFVELFDDMPFEGQETPRHIWKWVNEDVFMFTHWNEEDVSEADELDYFGLGVSGQATPSARAALEDESVDGYDFSHFHQWEAENWGSGHHADSQDQYGYWLTHHSVREVQYPFHDEPIDIGVDRGFFPTELPDE